MTAILLDGEAVAARIRAEVGERATMLAARGVYVGLGTILVGDDARARVMSRSSTKTAP